jgi:outer membrane protein
MTVAILQAQEQLGLSDCLIQTLSNNPKIKAEQLAQDKENFIQYERKNSFLPQIDGYINYGNYFNDLPTYIFPQEAGTNLSGEPQTGPYPIGLGLPQNLNTGLEIKQMIFDMSFFGKSSLNQHFQTYQDVKLSVVQEDVLYGVAALYYQIAINEETATFLDSNLDRLAKLQSIVKLQAEQGFAKQSDYEKLLVKTANLKAKKNKLRAGIRTQIRYLKLMMGMPQDKEITIKRDDEYMFSSEIISMEKGDLPEERVLEEQKVLNSINAKKIDGDYYPKLQGYASFLIQAQRESFNFFQQGQDWYNINQWGLRLSIPIMHGLEKQNKKDIAKIVDAQISLGLDQKKIQNEIEFEQAKADLSVAREEQQAQLENVVLAEKIFKQSELSYQEGTILLMEFLDAEALLREAKNIYATALLDTKLTELKIIKASGNIMELVNQ